MLSENDILNFQAIYESRFGIKISKKEAIEKGVKLLGLMSLLYKPKKEVIIKNNKNKK